MTPELTALTLAALLQVAQFCLYSVLGNLQVGTRTAFGPRDMPTQLTGYAGRAHRAMNNHFEGLILFSIAVYVLTSAGKTTEVTSLCAWTYLGARAAYVPAYLFGLSPWRSVIWFIGFAATLTMLITALT